MNLLKEFNFINSVGVLITFMEFYIRNTDNIFRKMDNYSLTVIITKKALSYNN